MDIEQAADALWAGIRRGEHMPPAWRGRLTMAQGYAVNLAILRRRVADGDAQAGWKVGLTSAAMRAQWGVPEPCFGVLMRSGHRESGARLAFDALIAPGIENELCLTMGDTLRGPGATADDAARALGAVAPALEVVEVRGDFAADLALAMADNAQQKAFVTGADTPFDRAMALEAASVEVRFGDERRDAALGAEVMGGPLHSIAWLANKLAEFGLALEAGSRVMSGSFTRQHRVARGDVVTARFAPFGDVTATFD
ncbi:MAG TPA: fumarylacetoacetate hydrolase family protein [Burkholderiaceae bacterium]|nr:fumarylacetoacetate hydrolase family protein [Burkholderiaceae bacterium]